MGSSSAIFRVKNPKIYLKSPPKSLIGYKQPVQKIKASEDVLLISPEKLSMELLPTVHPFKNSLVKSWKMQTC